MLASRLAQPRLRASARVCVRVRAAQPAAPAPAKPATFGVFGPKTPERYARLQLGRTNHTLSVFVADESGLIARVASVFARRGYNIESLAVGLSNERALFTVVVAGTDSSIHKLLAQVRKLVSVRFAHDLTPDDRVEREMALIKVRITNDTHVEVVQLVRVFRGRVVDVSDHTVTCEVTGDPGKVLAAQQALSRYGVVCVVRTGRIALRRGAATSTMRESTGRDLPNYDSSEEDDATAPDADAAADAAFSNLDVLSPLRCDARQLEGDGAEAAAPSGAEGEDDSASRLRSRVLSVTVDNSFGVLNRVAAVLSRRGHNVQSLAVGPAEEPGESRITIVVPGSETAARLLVRQIEKLPSVVSAVDLTDVPRMTRELMLIKVRARGGAQRRDVVDVSAVFRGRVVDYSAEALTIEATGSAGKISALQSAMQEYGVLEVARTGLVAMQRESGIDSSLLARLGRTEQI